MANAFIELIKKRRSIRSFQKKDVPDQIIKQIIDCARL
ncbi:MAG TPA: nitroreductase family protein, partial [bacterium]|nr:nitroreductase family protein [bacterium]